MICMKGLEISMKRIKQILPIIIAFIIGISTTVGAVTVFNSKDITYSSDKTTKTNVKDSLDELYTNLGKCPNGMWCYNSPMTIADKVELGDYIRMTPTSASYTISKNLTGYESDQVINTSELDLWRVIRKNADGTVEVVSEYVSSEEVTFYGKTGFLNYVAALHYITDAYKNKNYVENVRHFGWNGQPSTCENISSCPNIDKNGEYELVNKVLGNLNGITKKGEKKSYFVAQRKWHIYNDHYWCYFEQISNEGKWKEGLVYYEKISEEAKVSEEISASIRPILVLSSKVEIKSGDGKSKETAYNLE